MLCNVVTRGIVLLNFVQQCYMLPMFFFHVVQCCYMLPRIITCCAMLLDVTKSNYMLSSVAACNLELLHAMQCCYMLPRFIICCPVLLKFI